MNSKEHQLSVNDYLDLYLYAKRMGDPLWQQEIIETLQNFHNGIRKEIQTITITHLLEKYNHLNEEILAIYQQLRTHSSNDYLIGKIQELKQQRISLGRQIQLAKNHSSQIM